MVCWVEMFIFTCCLAALGCVYLAIRELEMERAATAAAEKAAAEAARLELEAKEATRRLAEEAAALSSRGWRGVFDPVI